MDNKNNTSQLLLLLGCQRSGTTLLASLLGGHSEINMLFESLTNDTYKLIGKKYSGNKLLTWRQIRMAQRASKFGHLINRIANLDFAKTNVPHKVRLYPNSKLCVEDYLKEGAKIITITRNKEDVVNSILKRTKASRKQAEYEYDKSQSIIDSLNNSEHDVLAIQFLELVNDTENVLKKVCQFLSIEYQERMLKGVEYNFVYPNTEVVAKNG